LKSWSLSPPFNAITKGDLNLVLDSKERRGGSIVRKPYRDILEDLVTRFGFNPGTGITLGIIEEIVLGLLQSTLIGPWSKNLL
jgi:hypothetical protein